MAEQKTGRSWRDGWRSHAYRESVDELLLEGHVAHLQQQVRILRALTALSVVGVAALAALALWPQGKPEAMPVLRVQRLEVVGADDRPLVVLDADAVGGRIALRYNREGNPPPPALFIAAAPEGGALQLFEPGQNFYALALEVTREGRGRVAVRGRDLRKGVALHGPAMAGDGGEVLVFAANGGEAVRLGTDSRGRGVVSTADEGR